MTRLLVVMGSGETAPTMVTVHREVVARMDPPPRPGEAVLLETSYGFQENADDLSERARAYFATSVGLPVSVAAGLRAPASQPGPEVDRGLAALGTARWLFAGPGSPSYALGQWRGSGVADALRRRLAPDLAGAADQVTVFSSAAACTLGAFALPVYEVYKVGAPPAWLEGLDVTGPLGLPAAVVPHFDNAEGGTHDTRYCYMGERRLRLLEEQLPEQVGVLGIDEHTAAVVDLAEGTLSVLGRGAVTVRRRGQATRLAAGTVVEVAEVGALLRGRGAAVPPAEPVPRQGGQPAAPGSQASLAAATGACEDAFARAEAEGDFPGMARAVCDLDRAVVAWSADTLQSDELDGAHAALRALVTRLGEAAAAGARDPGALLRPVVEPLLALRARLRAERSFAVADAVRDALIAGGLQLGDGAEGSSWSYLQA